MGGPDLQRGVRVAEPEQHTHALRRGDGDVDPRPAVVHPTTREPQRLGEPVVAVDRGDVEAGGGREPAGPCRVDRGRPAALARPRHPGREGGVPGPIGRVREQRLDRHARWSARAWTASTSGPAGSRPRGSARSTGATSCRPSGVTPSSRPRRVVAPAASRRPVSPAAAAPDPSPAAHRLGAEVVVGGAVGLPGQVVAGRVRPRRRASPPTPPRPVHPPAAAGPANGSPGPPRTRAADARTGAPGRGRESPCSPVCRGTCQPRGSTGKNLERILPNRTAADRDGHRGKGLRDGSSGHGNQERLECARCRCAVMSATVAAEVVQQVVQRCTVRLRSCRSCRRPVVQLEP